MENEHFFVSEQNSSPIYRVSSKTIVLGKGAGQSIDCVGNKQDETRRNIFGKMGDTGALIQGNKSAGHYFEVMDLIPISCNYEAANVHHRQNFWYNFLVKVITEAFFQYAVCKQGRDGVRDKVKGEDSVLW